MEGSLRFFPETFVFALRGEMFLRSASGAASMSRAR